MAEFKEISPNASVGDKLLNWVDNRFPASKLYKEHLSEYYAPKNFNFWYFFGSLALFVLVIQIVTGIFLVMHYKPDAAQAFASVEYIMRDVPWGWLIRYMHSTGASAFFVVVEPLLQLPRHCRAFGAARFGGGPHHRLARGGFQQPRWR